MKKNEECLEDLGDISEEETGIIGLLEGERKRKDTKSI